MKAELDSFFPYRLAATAEAFSRNLVDVYGRQYGLSREEWRLLFLLAEGQSVTSTELSRKTTLDKVQVSRASQRLADKGLITRQIPPSDRRLRLYTCTDAGAALFAQILPQVQQRATEILNTMSQQDLEALERGLAALSDAINETAGSDLLTANS